MSHNGLDGKSAEGRKKQNREMRRIKKET